MFFPRLFALMVATISVASAATPLSSEVAAKIDKRVASAPASSKPIFSTRNDDQASYVRNTACWAYGLDLTPLSVWNSSGGPQQAGTLVSPRHVVAAQHFPFGTGAKLRWITADNQVVERVATAAMRIGNTDIYLALLDQAVPASISFARVLPANYASKLPPVGLPVVCSDQEKKALVSDVKSVANGIVTIGQPANSKRASFYEVWVSGDSGSAGLLFVRKQPVLLLTATEPISGPDYSALQGAINSGMAELGGGYQLTPAVLEDAPKANLEESGAVVIEPK